MMRQIRYTKQFQKDFKRLQKQGKDLTMLKRIVGQLAAGETLSVKYKDHPLRGNYARTRDCHIAPDWVLIYVVVEDELRLIRTGSHAELFEQ